jgi:transposase-like protein
MRNGNFYPMILVLLKDQQEEAQRVAYSLYRKGLTTQDVGEVLEELYGKKYSTSKVSRMSIMPERRRKNVWSGPWKVIIRF